MGSDQRRVDTQRRSSAGGRAATGEGTRIGYEIVGNEAYLAARRRLEIGPADGPRKVHAVTAAPYH